MSPRGFTLVELVMVMAIISVLAAIAIPRYQSSVAAYRARGAAERLAMDIDSIRRTAIAGSQTYRFRTALNWKYYESCDLASGWAGGTVVNVNISGEPYRAVFAAVDLGNDGELIFNGFGAPDGAASMTIASGNAAFKVAVEDKTARTTVTRVVRP